jgi:ubiquinone/menaquinone biosynthesis C-methylase UbiE/uncharacterized protein YbaR (Trm112 family)
MKRFTLDELLAGKLVCCPKCRATELQQKNEGSITCMECDMEYGVINDIPLLLQQQTNDGTKQDIQAFWGELYQTIYKDTDDDLDQTMLRDGLVKLEKLFIHRRHLAVVEMPVADLKGKRILEIGSGAGAFSALFKSLGAEVFSVDITLDRVISTAKKLDLVDDDHKCCALQTDAECLPFPDDHFDIVFSNGVLHHTPKTEQSVQEVYRVLKPGGKAVIMLYARHSFLYWFNLFFIRGILFGRIFRDRNWLGKSTEWMSDKKQTVYNPETKVYSVRDIENMFSQFANVATRKNSFDVRQIPIIGNYISRLIGVWSGYNDAGMLIYGIPWRNESQMELWLGKYVGFCLNITAKK